jgi:hypothetical protein
VYPFEVSEETMTEYQTRFEEVLKKIEWHYTNRRYDLPYELATGQMKL